MDAEEFYVPTNWYGIAPIAATIFVPFVALYILVWAMRTRSKAPARS